MDRPIQCLLAPRIENNCLPRLRDGYFRDAVREAMIEVEKALKEKGRAGDRQFGVNLIRSLFSGKPGGVRLRVPLGETMQQEALRYFEGVFSYYRNYAAHDGSQIDGRIASRVLIIASELLDLIDASELTLTDSGGIDGLVRVGGFGSAERLCRLLTLLDDYHIPESTYDGLFEDMARNGLDESSLEAAFRLNLVEMHSAKFEAHADEFWGDTELVEWFELTFGRDALDALAVETGQKAATRSAD
jgi:hypothetical protein